jgi:ribosome-associated translation inhibitor RaiA
MFSGLRTNSLFYILEKGEKPVLKVGQVSSVSNPSPKYGQYPTTPMFGQQMETVVDVSVKVGDETMEFKQLPSNLSIANLGQNVVVSENKDAMNAEVEAMLRNSRGILESVSYHESVIASCDSILRELNPQLAKEKAQEEKIVGLEDQMGKLSIALSSIQEMLAQALNSSANTHKNNE